MSEFASTSYIDRIGHWFGRATWRILAAGVVVAILVAATLFYAMMAPSLADMSVLVMILTAASILSVGLGYFLYWRGWTRSSSILLTLMGTYLWASLLTIFTVWLLQRQMFFSDHDLILSSILLLFAAIIATTIGLFVAVSITDGLRQMAAAAGALASGDLGARVPVVGRDEVSRLSKSFNEMAMQLQDTADRQQELDKLRRNLIAWTSHDLRTPLTSIRARVEALNDGLVDDSESVRRYYVAIRSDVLALNTIIDDLFEMAQLNAGGYTMERAPSSLSDLVSDCLESFNTLATLKGITLKGKVDPTVDPVLMNAGKIGRVLNNLVENALHHTQAGGRVTVRAEVSGDGVLVSVEDNGPGISEHDLPFVFDQFYRGEEARSRDTGSTGLGLAIARGIVEGHRGRIWAENRAEGGARFSIILPR
ncbi:MAG TPA: HAMP domain-containing sensor histidine kinase [Promineifilum sp.]